MTDFSPGAIVFDLDGTLVDTSRDLIEAANRIFRQLDLDVRIDPVADRAMGFNGGRALLKLGFSRLADGADSAFCHEELYARYLEEYAQRVSVHSRTYAGTEVALQTLAACGWRLGICTNKPERPARILLAALGLAESFAVIVGADTHPFRKPDPRVLHQTVAALAVPHRATLMVGDSWTDAQVAERAGVPFVLYEPEAPADLRKAVDPRWRFSHYEALPTLAERLLAENRAAA